MECQLYKFNYLLKYLSKIPVDILQLSLNILAMCNELDRNPFCIIDSHLSTSSFIFDQPLSNSLQ